MSGDIQVRPVLTPADRSRVAPLFASVPWWRAFIESATEREIGTLSVDDPGDPEVAVLFYGGLVVYGGRPEGPAAESAVHLHEIQPLALAPDEWARLFRRCRAGRFHETTRYHLPSESIDPRKLQDAMSALAGLIRSITPDMLPGIEASLGWEHHAHHFDDVDHFVADGYARAVAARYVQSCRDADLAAPWDAADRESVGLARSIGYEGVEEYTVFEQV